jgi:hypothetical protein
MIDQTQLEILKNNSIEKGLDAFHTSFNHLVYKDRTLFYTPDTLDQLTQKNKTIWLQFPY